MECGDFLFLLQSVPAPQNHCHLNFGLITQRRMLLTWCWFSGGEMTGKFRKVASHYAPEPAFGLFLNLPWGVCPLEPRHVNGVSIPAKCPPDIPSEDLLIDQDAVLHLYKGALHSLIYPLLIYQPEMLWLILFMEKGMKKGVENLCENEIIQ